MSVFVTFIVEMTNGIFRSQSGALLGLFDSETRFDTSKRYAASACVMFCFLRKCNCNQRRILIPVLVLLLALVSMRFQDKIILCVTVMSFKKCHCIVNGD